MYLPDIHAFCSPAWPEMTVSGVSCINMIVEFLKLVGVASIPELIFKNLAFYIKHLLYIYAQTLRFFYFKEVSYFVSDTIFHTHF